MKVSGDREMLFVRLERKKGRTALLDLVETLSSSRPPARTNLAARAALEHPGQPQLCPGPGLLSNLRRPGGEDALVLREEPSISS
jgi:hypothetical protein